MNNHSMLKKMGALLVLAILLLLLESCHRCGYAAEYFLRAAKSNVTMPDGTQLPVWGFAKDSSFGAKDGKVTVPGPVLQLSPGDTTLIIHLDNDLSEPVSLMIPGQISPMEPVRNPDGRIRSLTKETPPGNNEPVDYIWNNINPGTFIYQSASHMAVQFQMGLFGALIARAEDGSAYGTGTPQYGREQIIILSEADLAIHTAVANGTFGSGKSMQSTISYKPRYFFINGSAYVKGQPPIDIGPPNTNILLRILNCCLSTRSLVTGQRYSKTIAEDGHLKKYPEERLTILMPPGKTKDVIVAFNEEGLFPLFDRRLALTYKGFGGGGMFAFLRVGF